MTEDTCSSVEVKRLFLLRHATALSNSTGGDVERALSPKGIEDATALGSIMRDKSYHPKYVLCSSATRTSETLEALEQSLDFKNIKHLDCLYSGTAGDYLNEIQKISDNQADVLLIGHNPSIYELAVRLVKDDHNSTMQRLSEGYHPASLSVLECQCQKWQDIQFGGNILADFMDPIDYNAPARPTRWM